MDPYLKPSVQSLREHIVSDSPIQSLHPLFYFPDTDQFLPADRLSLYDSSQNKPQSGVFSHTPQQKKQIENVRTSNSTSVLARDHSSETFPSMDGSYIAACPMTIGARTPGIFLFFFDNKQDWSDEIQEDINQELEQHLPEFGSFWLALQNGFSSPHPFFMGNTGAWDRIKEQLLQATRFNFPVYIYGERGTGKEFTAEFIHAFSERHDGEFVKLNCTALPESLAEAELFGHAEGAYTGAQEAREGYFGRADQGTFLLDEIGDLSMENQNNLLRVLQTGEISPVGSSDTRHVDVRILVSTNRQLETLVEKQSFRSDLLDRLNVIRIELSPLRKWKNSLHDLIDIYLRELRSNHQFPEIHFTDSALEALQNYSFPGNARELYNLVRKIHVQTGETSIDRDAIHAVIDKPQTRSGPEDGVPRGFRDIFEASNPTVLKENAEHIYLQKALEEQNGDVKSVANKWDCTPQEVYRLCKKHELSPKNFR